MFLGNIVITLGIKYTALKCRNFNPGQALGHRPNVRKIVKDKKIFGRGLLGFHKLTYFEWVFHSKNIISV